MPMEKIVQYIYQEGSLHLALRGGRLVRWCWVNFQCRRVLLILKMVVQGHTALAVGVVGLFFSSLSPVFPSLVETAR